MVTCGEADGLQLALPATCSSGMQHKTCSVPAYILPIRLAFCRSLITTDLTTTDLASLYITKHK
jgi:hypothetical protein